MKNSKLLFLLTLVACIGFVSCDEFPNVNDDEVESDIFSVEIMESMFNLDTVFIDNSTALLFSKNVSWNQCGLYKLGVINGNVLASFDSVEILSVSPFFVNVPIQLDNGDLLNGASNGLWAADVTVTSGINKYYPGSSFPTCIETHHIAEDQDVFIGFRVKDLQNKWHYGWIVMCTPDLSTSSFRAPFVKSVSYNRTAENDVIIGE